MTDKMQALLPVVQADRDLVFGLLMPAARTPLQKLALEYIRDGKSDDADAVQQVARHRISHSLPGDAHPDLQGHIADGVRDACGIVIGKVVSFDDSRAIAATIADRIKIANAEYAAALTPSALSPEHCQRCGHNNPSWSAPSPLWNAVIRGGSIDGEPKFDDMVCAACFMELAEQQGIASDWTVKARNVAVPLETTTPSGRIWDDDKGLWVSPLSGEADHG